MSEIRRVIYQSEAVFVGPTPATGQHFSSGNSGANLITQLHRIQTANYNFNVTRQDVNQFGELAAISREIVEAPTVALDFSYLLTNVLNESRMGFVVDGSVSAISGLISSGSNVKNYFIETVPEGNDAVGFVGQAQGVIGIGNGFITSYASTAAVGGLPTVTVNVEGINIKMDDFATGQDIPAVNPVDGSLVTGFQYDIPAAVQGVVGQVPALRPGDITVSIVPASGTGIGVGIDIDDSKIQNYNISFSLARTPLQKLGNKFAFSREITFPVTVTASIEALVGDLTTGSLSDVLCNDKEYNMIVTLRKPACTGVGAIAVQYDLRKVKLDSESFSSSIGPAKTVALTFSTQLGGPQATGIGLFLSGSLI